MTEKEINEFADGLEYTNGIYGFKQGVKLQKQKQDEFAIGFTEWCDDDYFRMGTTNIWSGTTDWEDNLKFTTKELLEIYKKEKGL